MDYNTTNIFTKSKKFTEELKILYERSLHLFEKEKMSNNQENLLFIREIVQDILRLENENKEIQNLLLISNTISSNFIDEIKKKEYELMKIQMCLCDLEFSSKNTNKKRRIE